MKAFNGKPTYLEAGERLRAYLACIKMTDTRSGLIEIYRGAKNYFGQGIELANVVEACKKRTDELLASEALKNAKS